MKKPRKYLTNYKNIRNIYNGNKSLVSRTEKKTIKLKTFTQN